LPGLTLLARDGTDWSPGRPRRRKPFPAGGGRSQVKPLARVEPGVRARPRKGRSLLAPGGGDPMVQRPEAKGGPGLRQAAWAGHWRQVVLGVLLGFLMALPAAAQVDGLLSEGSRIVEGPVVALFPLQALNQTPADSEDLRLLAEALPDALAARLVQSGQFRPLTGVRLQRHLGAAGMPAADGDATAEGMRAW